MTGTADLNDSYVLDNIQAHRQSSNVLHLTGENILAQMAEKLTEGSLLICALLRGRDWLIICK